MAKLSEIGRIAREKTNTEFGEILSSYTSLTSDEIQKLFPAKTDREELAGLIEIINADISDMDKKRKVIENIEKFSGAVLKLGKFFGAG